MHAWRRLHDWIDRVRWWIVFPLALFVWIHSWGLFDAFAWSPQVFKATVGMMGMLVLDGLARLPTQSTRSNMEAYRLPDVHNVTKTLFDHYVEDFRRNSTSMVKVLGLSLFHSWPAIRKFLLTRQEDAIKPDLNNISIQIAIINPDSTLQRDIQSEWADDARNTCAQIDAFNRKFADVLHKNNIVIEYRKVDVPFVVHGFIVNDQSVYWSFASPVRVGNKSQLAASRHNYYQAHRYGPTSDVFQEVFLLLSSWFDYHWDTAKAP